MTLGLLTTVTLAGLTATGDRPEVFRKRTNDLIAAMEKDRSKVVALVKLTGRDFGPRPEIWTKWLKQTTDKQLTQIRLRNRRAEELQMAWNKFATSSAGISFGFLQSDPDERKKAEAELDEIGKTSPEPRAWGGYSTGIGHLTSGDRVKAAKSFREVFTSAPLSHYAARSDELATLLEQMVEEDKAWVEPKDLDKLNAPQQVQYYIHHMRDVRVEQWSQPGTCNVLAPGFLGLDAQKKPNAAIKLKKIGNDAIPALIEILDDRRPIGSVGHWRNYWPDRTVLRYQDAAIQILDALLPVAFYRGSSTSAYLSTEDPEVRYRMIALLRDWQKAGVGKSEVEQLWIAVKLKPGIHPTMKLLGILAREEGQKEAVLKELRAMYQTLHRVYRPFVVELMAELGDTSKVSEVLDMLDTNEFQKYFGERFEDDTVLFLNAEDAAKRVKAKYSPKPSQPSEKK